MLQLYIIHKEILDFRIWGKKCHLHSIFEYFLVVLKAKKDEAMLFGQVWQVLPSYLPLNSVAWHGPYWHDTNLAFSTNCYILFTCDYILSRLYNFFLFFWKLMRLVCDFWVIACLKFISCARCLHLTIVNKAI